MSGEKNREIEPDDQPVFVDDLSAPTVLFDSIAGAIESQGVLTFGCVQTILQVNGDGGMAPVKKMVLRLAVPTGTIESLAEFFKIQHQRMIDDGTIEQDKAGISKSGN